MSFGFQTLSVHKVVFFSFFRFYDTKITSYPIRSKHEPNTKAIRRDTLFESLLRIGSYILICNVLDKVSF